MGLAQSNRSPPTFENGLVDGARGDTIPDAAGLNHTEINKVLLKSIVG
jgi:hypothetical protein